MWNYKTTRNKREYDCYNTFIHLTRGGLGLPHHLIRQSFLSPLPRAVGEVIGRAEAVSTARCTEHVVHLRPMRRPSLYILNLNGLKLNGYEFNGIFNGIYALV